MRKPIAPCLRARKSRVASALVCLLVMLALALPVGDADEGESEFKGKIAKKCEKSL